MHFSKFSLAICKLDLYCIAACKTPGFTDKFFDLAVVHFVTNLLHISGKIVQQNLIPFALDWAPAQRILVHFPSFLYVVFNLAFDFLISCPFLYDL